MSELAFSPDGRLLATSGGGRGLEMWDVATANQWGSYEHKMHFADGPIAFHPTEAICFALARGGIAEIETDTKKARTVGIHGRKYNTFNTAALTPDGAAFVCHSNSHYLGTGSLGYLRWTRNAELRPTWSLAMPDRRRQSHRVPRPRLIRISPDGKTILTLDGIYIDDIREVGIAEVWPPPVGMDRVTLRSVRDGEELQKAALPSGTSTAVAFAPDSRTFVTCRASTTSVWNADDLKAKPRQVKGGTQSRLTGIAFHPSGRYLAASNDRTVTLYDTTMWKPVRSFVWTIGKLRSVCFSPDGTLAAAGSHTGKVVVWDVDV